MCDRKKDTCIDVCDLIKKKKKKYRCVCYIVLVYVYV